MGEMVDDLMDQALMYECEMQAHIECREWVTREQGVIKICDMTSRHLRNAVAFIERGGEIYGCADQYLPLLKEELERRGE